MWERAGKQSAPWLNEHAFVLFFKAQVQVGEVVAKLFQKPEMKKKMVYFGEVDVVYENADPDVFCHVRYEDDDEEDFSYLEL